MSALEPIITTKKLAYEYIRRDEEGNVEGITRAVDGVSIDVKAGEFIAILGSNGSGKSTFAHHLNVLLDPTEGTVLVDGKDTSDKSLTLDIRKTAGMVLQNPDNQIIGQVVEEDVGFGPENLGVPTEEIWRRVDEALNKVKLTPFRKLSPNKLSGGQKQRLSIAGILAMKPKCLILDEPTAMLDPTGRREVLEAVKELNKKEGITVILITHFMDEAVDADRCIVMDKGHVVLSGEPKAVFSQVEMLTNMKLEVPAVTRLSYDLIQKGIPLKRGILKREELVKELARIYEANH